MQFLAVLSAFLTMFAASAQAQTKLAFAFDWKFEAPSAPYFAAVDKGFFTAEGLDVTISPGKGSLDAIPKVANGHFQFGFADINSLTKYLDNKPDAPVIAVMMIYDKPPFAVIGRKSLGVLTPADLENRVLGAPPPDGAWAQFAAFAKANRLDLSQLQVRPVTFGERETLLAQGKLHAVTGYSFSSFLNLIRLGVPENDINVMLMADHGLQLYGNAIIVNTDFADANPDIVTRFLRAVAKGWRHVIAKPSEGLAMLAKRNPEADVSLEALRLSIVIQDNVLTDYARKNGIGKIDRERFRVALKQLGQNYKFKTPPRMERIFDDRYLPESINLKLF